MTVSCDKCNALCCKYFCFEIDEPDDYDEFENVRWYLCHEGVSVHVDEDGDWYIQIANTCTKLTSDGRCAIYEDRPLICRSYSGANCEATGNDYGYREEFNSPEQLVDYARKVLGENKYNSQMVRERAKLEGITAAQMRLRLFGPPPGRKKTSKTRQPTPRTTGGETSH